MQINKLLKYSASPHIKKTRTTKFIMANVAIALLPTYIAGIIFFGFNAFLWVFLAVISAVLAEGLYLLIEGKKIKEIINQFDFSSVVTGMLVGLTIGINYPWYSTILGSAFAIIVVKMFFGGTGKNIVNPAIVGRIFIFISFQAVATSWYINSKEVITGATTLTNFFETGSYNVSNLDLFLGRNLAGCIGEVSKLAIIIGAIYLAVLGIIDIQYPIVYIAVCGLFQVALQGFDFALFLPDILSGGLMLGAFFMATDYVTTPNTTISKYIYFACLGLLTAGLRVATNMEVVSFAILLMNLTVPLFDKFIQNRPFGYQKPQKEARK